MAAHACNLSTLESEIGRSQELKDNLDYKIRVLVQSGLQSKILSKQQKMGGGNVQPKNLSMIACKYTTQQARRWSI